jgi:hypothetical protein
VLGWGQKRPQPAPPAPSHEREEVRAASLVFPKFLSAVGRCQRPVVLDLGPVVGSNIEFFGERLACKIHIGDLFADIETAARAGTQAGLSTSLPPRLKLPPGSVDGILCWDVFDFLDRKAGLALASHLETLLRSGGALHGFFGTTQIDLTHYTRYVVEQEDRFRLRPYPATTAGRCVLLTRDVTNLFDRLVLADSVLLKSGYRETLFRRPA